MTAYIDSALQACYVTVGFLMSGDNLFSQTTVSDDVSCLNYILLFVFGYNCKSTIESVITSIHSIHKME